VDGAYLAVARLRKPHGLKGEVVAWTLTDEPEHVLAVGRQLVPVDESGVAIGSPVVIERSRPYHRHWLLKFEKVDSRDVLDEWRQRLFGVPQDELTPPREDELYEHEVPGTRVLVQGREVGQATGLVDLPGGGHLLVVDVAGREVLIPFRRPIVKRVDRAAREIEIEPPDGLLEL